MKIFLDLGTHLGEGLIRFNNKLKFNDEWKIYSFEPNPECKINSLNLPFEVEFIEKAIWIENGIITFQQDDRNSDKIGEGSNLCDVGWVKDWYIEPIEVESIDFSEFVNNLPDCYIFCKMDIEGAEFEVLNKMIDDGTISKINEIDCEFHGMSNLWKTRDEIINKMKSLGVIVHSNWTTELKIK